MPIALKSIFAIAIAFTRGSFLHPVHSFSRPIGLGSHSLSSPSSNNHVFIYMVSADKSSSTSTVETTRDESAPFPASIVYYDDVLNPETPHGVVCARGVCVLSDYDDDDYLTLEDDVSITFSKDSSLPDRILHSYLGPRILLGIASVLYGTNFPLGSMMNDVLPASAASADRMVLASIALSPFLFKLNSKLISRALLCGCFTATGYITQSLALVGTSPAKVAFLGAATVLVCPALEFFVSKRDLSLNERPQTWLAAALCLAGVGILEIYDPSGKMSLMDQIHQIGFGDMLALMQAVGFGTSFFLTEKMMTEIPGQALPITAVQVSVCALICMIWCFSESWMGTPGAEHYALPGLFTDPSIQHVAGAVFWTGLITTALNRFVETTALGKISSAEASVILATEPLWAALFAALWLSEDFGANDYIGGALIVGACLATSLKKEDFVKFHKMFGKKNMSSKNMLPAEPVGMIE
mmetsp:Transcript_12857/g.27077  ORF Transcript_12857/g.27077 Transcript_12857/m.27077 type:complete len:469 (-) Transcript_12857:77-1483(-)